MHTSGPVWVLDTNVLISGLLSPHGPPGRLLDMVLAGRLILGLDDRIEGEYREVLARPKFQIDPERQNAILAILAFQFHVVAPPWEMGSTPVPDDTLFLEVARACPDQILVTGNMRHFPRRIAHPITVLTPRAAWDRLIRSTP